MRFRGLVRISMVVLIAQLVSGCGAVIQSAMVGAGKAATAEDTGFLKSYKGLAPGQDPAYPVLPDLSYVSPQARMSAYKKIIIPDFTSITPDIDKLKGLQIRQYKGIKQELPDLIASTFDGSAFSRVTRVSERIDPKDMTAIRKLPADAVLMGNIKELVSLGGENHAGLTAIQIEYKLIDVRTGEEVVTAIHRSTTDLDKVAMGQLRVLTGLLNKAKAVTKNGVQQTTTVDAVKPVSDQAPSKPAEVKNDRRDPTGLIGKTITPPALPKNSDTSLTSYGNNYFECGGGMIGDGKSNLSFTFLRQGLKTKCGVSKLVVAITRSSNNNKTFDFLDAIPVVIPKGYAVLSNDCEGGDITLTKLEQKDVLTNHLKAWNIVGNRFVPVLDLKKVKCNNPGSGD